MKLFTKSVFVSLVLLFVVFSPAHAQEQDPFHNMLQLGRGYVQSLEWQPNGMLLLVNTQAGAWLYTENLEVATQLPDLRLASFNPDGIVLAGIAPTNQIKLLDAKTLEPVRTLQGHETRVTHLVWSPDGNKLVSADGQNNVFIWDTTTGRKLCDFVSSPLERLGWSPDSSLLAIDDRDYISILDISRGEIVQAFRIFSNDGFAWRNNQELLAWHGDVEASSGRLLNIITGEPVARFLGSGGTKAEYNSTGSLLASTGYNHSTVVDTETEEEILVSDGDSLFALTLAWSSDEQHLAFGYGYHVVDSVGKIQIGDVTTRRIVQTWDTHSFGVSKLAWSSDATKLASVGSFSNLAVWQVDTGELLASNYEHSYINDALAISSDNRSLALVDAGNTVQVHDMRSGELEAQLEIQSGPGSKLQWQPGGEILVASTLLQSPAENGHHLGYDLSLLAWDLSQWEPANPAPPFSLAFEYPVKDFAWNPRGSQLAATDGSEVQLWEPASGAIEHFDPLAEADGSSELNSVSWNPDGSMLATVHSQDCSEQIVQLWDTNTLQLVATEFPAAAQFHSSTFSGRYVITPDNSLLRISWRRGGCGHSWVALIYAPQMRVSYSGSARWPSDFSMETEMMPDIIRDAALSPDGERLAAVDNGNRLMIWQTRTGERYFQADGVSYIAWSPDSTMIAVWAKGEALRILNTTTGEMITLLVPYIEQAAYVQWTRDSQTVVINADGVVTVWQR